MDREEYPQIAQKLDNEIARRERKSSENSQQFQHLKTAANSNEQDSQIVEISAELAVEFHGSAWEYHIIWIVNLCLTLVSLGIIFSLDY